MGRTITALLELARTGPGGTDTATSRLRDVLEPVGYSQNTLSTTARARRVIRR